MKIPSIPLQIVFKVVQVDSCGRMWSANPSPSIVKGNGEHVVRYKLRHQVLPESDCPALFACPTLEDAKTAAQFYATGYCVKKVYILRGYAAGVRSVRRATVRQDKAFAKKQTDSLKGLPSDFATVLCDWFIPIGIVKKL